jgi:superfamily II DNA or RNA helicase
MSTKEREDTLEKFRNGEILVLTNVQLLVEGVDIPGIEVLQWLRPTQSLIVWMQGNGRGFRPSEGKDKLTILDHVNNWSRHGMPDTQREWSLDGRPKQKRGERDSQDLGIQSCGHCLHVFRSGVSVCPRCGKEVELKERKIEQVDGLLEKIERQNEIRHKKIEQGTARSLEDLVALGIRRKLNNAAGWAVNVYSKRQKRAATAADYQAAKQAYGRLAATTQETA